MNQWKTKMWKKTPISMCLRRLRKNYLKSFKYVEAHVNVLDEVPQSYSHQGNLEMDQTRYTTETKDHGLWIWM